MRQNVRVIGTDMILPRTLHDEVRETTQRLLHDLTWKERQRELREAQRPKAPSLFSRINYWTLLGFGLGIASAALVVYGLVRVAEWMVGE